MTASRARANSGSSTPSSTRRFKSSEVGTPASRASRYMRVIVERAEVSYTSDMPEEWNQSAERRASKSTRSSSITLKDCFSRGQPHR